MPQESKIVEDVLRPFEDIHNKTVEAREIVVALNLIIPKDRNEISKEWLFEKTAFDLIPNISGKVDLGKGEFFNNSISLLDSKQHVTPEFLTFWEGRAMTPINPVLVRQYSALVIDISPKIRKSNPPFAIVRRFLEVVVSIVKYGYCGVHTYNLHWLEIAFYQAVRFNQVDDVTNILETILDYEVNNGSDKFPGHWGYAFEILNDKRSKVLKHTAKKVQIEMEGRFDRIEKTLIENEVDLNCAQRAFKLLSTYYNKYDKPSLKILFDRYAIIVKQKASTLNIFQHLKEIENLHLAAKSFGYHAEAKELLKSIRGLSAQTLPHFKLFSSEMQVNKELIDNLYQFFSEGEKDKIIQNLIVIFLPQIDKIREQMKADRQNYFFKQFLGEQIIGKGGIKTATLEPLNETNEKKHLIKNISQNISLSSLNLHTAFDAAILEVGLSSEDIFKFWMKSANYNKNVARTVQEGLKAYFDRNYIIFLCVIVPMIECIIRNNIEAVGGNVLKINPDESQELLTLGSLLTSPEAQTVFGEDLTLYIRTVLTERLGLNIRNDVAHGAYSDTDFNKIRADRIFHIFLLLSSAQYVKEI